MKIIITAVSPSIDAAFEPRYGRSANFIIVDTETMAWEAHPNQAVSASGGAGTMSAQFAAEHQVEAVVSGNFGPNAAAALNAAGISMYLNPTDGTVRDVAERFKAGELAQVSAPTVRGSHRSRGGF